MSKKGYSAPGGCMGPPEFMLGLIWACCRAAIEPMGGGAGLPADEGAVGPPTPECWAPVRLAGSEGRSSSLS